MLRGQSSLWYTTVTCFMISQLPGMPVATCSDPTRDLLWCRPRPHHHVILCHVHTHAHGPVLKLYVLTTNYVLKFEMVFNMFFVPARCLVCERFFEMIFERLLRIECIYMYMFIFACGILNCFQNSLCEARMRRSGVFSLTGFNPLLFFCVLLIVFFRYTNFSLDMSSASWIPVRCISICDALLVGLLCIHVRALHRVYVGYECIWKIKYLFDI